MCGPRQEQPRLAANSEEGNPAITSPPLAGEVYFARGEGNESGKAGTRGVRRVLREICFAGSRKRRFESARGAARADDATLCGTQRTGRQFSVCGGKMDGEGSAWAPHRFRANLYLSCAADCQGRQDSAGGIRTGRLCAQRRLQRASSRESGGRICTRAKRQPWVVSLAQ